MAKEGGYIPIKADDIGPMPGNKWSNLQAFFDQAQTRFEYGTVLGLYPGNYYIKALLSTAYPAGVALSAISARVTSNTALSATGQLTLRDTAEVLLTIPYTAVSLAGQTATFTVNYTPANIIKAGTLAWTDTAELVNVQAGATSGQSLAVMEGAVGVLVKGGPQLGDAGGCRVIGDTMTIFSLKQSTDVYEFYQEAIEDLEAGVFGIPIPSAANEVWLFIENNVWVETITITNPHLSVELVSGLRGITVVKNY